jgi:hypothetical protein
LGNQTLACEITQKLSVILGCFDATSSGSPNADGASAPMRAKNRSKDRTNSPRGHKLAPTFKKSKDLFLLIQGWIDTRLGFGTKLVKPSIQRARLVTKTLIFFNAPMKSPIQIHIDQAIFAIGQLNPYCHHGLLS